MIDVKQVRELIELMVEHGLSEIRIRQGETVVNLRRGPGGEPVIVPIQQAAPATPAPAPQPTSTPGGAPYTDAPPEDNGLIPITSPMVGTYYGTAEPDAPPFVRVGSEVTPDATVCIIEAMKVFNEIKAEVAGTIERILVQNEQAVEFGQPLMLVRPKS